MSPQNRKYEFETLFVRVLVFIVAFAIALAALSSCTSSKKVNKTITEETRTENVDSVVKMNYDSTGVHLEESIKESDNTIEFFADTICDTIFIPKIIYRPDGSFEATGVKKVNLRTTEWQKKYDSLVTEYNLEISHNRELSEQLKTRVIAKEKKSPVFLGWVLIFVIGSITGIVVYKKII